MRSISLMVFLISVASFGCIGTLKPADAAKISWKPLAFRTLGRRGSRTRQQRMLSQVVSDNASDGFVVIDGNRVDCSSAVNVLHFARVAASRSAILGDIRSLVVEKKGCGFSPDGKVETLARFTMVVGGSGGRDVKLRMELLEHGGIRDYTGEVTE